MPFPNKGVVLLDLNGRIAYASTYFCDLVGIEHGAIAGISCFDFVFPEDMGAARELLEANKRPNALPFQFRLRRKDGSPVWVKVQGTVLQTADAQIYAISASVTIAELKSVERGG